MGYCSYPLRYSPALYIFHFVDEIEFVVLVLSLGGGLENSATVLILSDKQGKGQRTPFQTGQVGVSRSCDASQLLPFLLRPSVSCICSITHQI